MRKKEFRISLELRLALWSMLIVTFYSCQTVYTTNPLPSADSPEAAAFPELLAGDYLVMEEGVHGSTREPGKQYIRITLTDKQHCLVESYFGFDMTELAAHTHAERFRIAGDYLIYKNDSLIQELATAKTRAEASPENKEYEKELKSLESLEKNGHLNQITPLTKRGNLMVYNRESLFEIDLAKNQFLTYDGSNLMETLNPKVRYHNNKLFLSNSDSKHGWENIIVDLSDEGIKGFDISFKHVLKNKAQYEKTANLNQPGNDAIIINPSLAELDKMLDEEGFLDEEVTLQRVHLTEETESNSSWWMIALGALVVVVILRVMRKPQIQA